MINHALGGRRLYVCVGDRDDLLDFVSKVVRGGVDIVQFREKNLDAKPLLSRATELRRLCNDLGVPFILNDRPDLAVACGADGVHVGQEDAPPSLCRQILGPDAVIGLSTHQTSELLTARHEPVDYISAGPVVSTPTKPGREGTGLSYLRQAADAEKDRKVPPFFVTGGVTPKSIPELAAAGASRFVVVRYLTESGDPERSARELAEAIQASVPG